jgi:hydroxymethylglutaryl-CoA lyase
VRQSTIPQLRDAEDVVAGLPAAPGVEFSALVLNRRGFERALGTGLPRVDIAVSVSDTHSVANSGMTREQAIGEAGRIAALARESRVGVCLGIATALGCPYEGFGPAGRVRDLVATARGEWGLHRVVVADTAGMATPDTVVSVVRPLVAEFPDVEFGLHLHDTRRMGLANALAGMLSGVAAFDASIGGLGGCPFAPGASGNIATEDLVNLADGLGIGTGIDLERLITAFDPLHALGILADSGVGKAGPSARVLPQEPTPPTSPGRDSS